MLFRIMLIALFLCTTRPVHNVYADVIEAIDFSGLQPNSRTQPSTDVKQNPLGMNLFDAAATPTVDSSANTDGTSKNLDTLNGLFLSARHALKNGDRKLALSELGKARAINSDLPISDVLIADLYLGSNQVPSAFQALEIAVKKQPLRIEPYMMFAELAHKQGRITDARLQLSHIETLKMPSAWSKKQVVNVRTRLAQLGGKIAESQQNWESAQEQFQRSLELGSKNPQLERLAHFSLARIAFAQKNIGLPTAN